jgi:cyanophycinase-like exopeptidase
LHGPVLILDGGGGSDSTAAFQLAIDRVRGCTGLRHEARRRHPPRLGGAGYNAYFMGMKGVNAVQSLVITDRDSSSRPDVIETVRNAPSWSSSPAAISATTSAGSRGRRWRRR